MAGNRMRTRCKKGGLSVGKNDSMVAQLPAGIPNRWMKRWVNPLAENRPLQIIHGIEPRGHDPVDITQTVQDSGADELPENGMLFYRNRGLGGVVCNVMFQNYLRSEPAWKALVAGVEDCRRLGMVVWIYDEAGYPSGAAGADGCLELVLGPSQAVVLVGGK